MRQHGIGVGRLGLFFLQVVLLQNRPDQSCECGEVPLKLIPTRSAILRQDVIPRRCSPVFPLFVSISVSWPSRLAQEGHQSKERFQTELRRRARPAKRELSAFFSRAAARVLTALRILISSK